MAFTKHIFAALLVSYGLSLAFWLILHVFNLPGFIFISLACALAGAAAGWLGGQRVWVSIMATFLLRILVYIVMVYAA